MSIVMDFSFITEYINTQDLVTGLIISGIGAGATYIFRDKIFKNNNANNAPTLAPIQSSTPDTSLQSIDSNTQPIVSKNDFSILFIDDDIELKMAENIKTEWSNTKTIVDSNNIKQLEIRNADVIFVDIQGVGKVLGFNDEGFGLAKAIKETYPKKKVVIYSATKKNDIYHDALQVCDKVLKKDANLYEFNNLIEKYYEELIAR